MLRSMDSWCATTCQQIWPGQLWIVHKYTMRAANREREKKSNHTPEVCAWFSLEFWEDETVPASVRAPPRLPLPGEPHGRHGREEPRPPLHRRQRRQTKQQRQEQRRPPKPQRRHLGGVRRLLAAVRGGNAPIGALMIYVITDLCGVVGKWDPYGCPVCRRIWQEQVWLVIVSVAKIRCEFVGSICILLFFFFLCMYTYASKIVNSIQHCRTWLSGCNSFVSMRWYRV